MRKKYLRGVSFILATAVFMTQSNITALATEAQELYFENEESEELEEALIIEDDAEVEVEVDITEEPVDVLSVEEINIPIEFINFGDSVDKVLQEKGQDAYIVDTYEIKRSIESGDYETTNYFDVPVIIKAEPYEANSIIDYVTLNDSEVHLVSYYCERYDSIPNAYLINLCLSKSAIESGETLRIYCHWDKNILSGYTLDANGAIFDETSFFDDSTITYTTGDLKNTKPIEGNDNNTTVNISYSDDKTKAYIPVMQNGFFPIPRDNTGIFMDLAGRPYEYERLPLVGWNTRKDGSGILYTNEDLLLEREYENKKSTKLKNPVTLYAIFPEYYGAEFILEGKSYVGDYWTNTPDISHTESIKNLFELAIKGTEKSFKKEGYTISWYLNEDCTIPADFSTRIDDCKRIEDRLSVYGKWTEIKPGVNTAYGTVFFKGVDGLKEGVKLEVGETLDLSKYVFNKKGYTFKNWTATVNGKTKKYSSNAKIKNLFNKDGQEFTLTANWVRNIYNITYVLNGGTQPQNSPKKYNVDSSTSLPTPTKTGFMFAGWDVKVDGKVITDSEELANFYDLKNNSIPKGACGNITLSAKFEPFEYKIVFHVKDLERPLTFSNYGEYDPLNYNDQINFNDAAMQIKEELAFKYGEEKVRDIQVKGFSRTEDGKIEFNRIDSYSGLSENEKEIHLYAILEDKTYSIDYHLESYDGATLSKPIYTFKYMNERFALPTAKCPGYRFYGWEFDQSPKSDKCLFYSWKRMYTPMGLYEFALTVAKAANNDIEVWPHFFPNKIKVYVSPNGAGVYEEDYDDTDSDYTKYKNVSGKRPFGIVYYQGDLASDWYDDTMTRWFRPGYELIGFSKNPKAKSADEIFTELTVENVNNLATSGSGTVYCIWEKTDITIDIWGATLLDGEEVINDDFYDYDYSSFPITIPYGKGVVLPKASLEGYDFLGWKTVENHLDKRFYKLTKKGEYITGVKAGTGYDVDIYPVFKRCKYKLSFNANGGTYNNKKSGCIKKNIDYSEDISSLVTGLNNKNVLRKGYKLLGFSLDPKGNTGIVLGADGKPIYKSHKLILNGKKNVTLYAIWKKIG